MSNYLKTHNQPCGCPFCGAERAAEAAQSKLSPATLLEELKAALSKLEDADRYFQTGHIASGKNMLRAGALILKKIADAQLRQ